MKTVYYSKYDPDTNQYSYHYRLEKIFGVEGDIFYDPYKNGHLTYLGELSGVSEGTHKFQIHEDHPGYGTDKYPGTCELCNVDYLRKVERKPS